MARPTFMRGGAYDGQLEDLIQASSWKQALSLCEKRIKKGDKSDEILVRSVLSAPNCIHLGYQTDCQLYR